MIVSLCVRRLFRPRLLAVRGSLLLPGSGLLKRHFLVTVRGKTVRVTANGMTLAREVERGVDRVDGWALVFARSLTEAKEKYQRREVSLWQS